MLSAEVTKRIYYHYYLIQHNQWSPGDRRRCDAAKDRTTRTLATSCICCCGTYKSGLGAKPPYLYKIESRESESVGGLGQTHIRRRRSRRRWSLNKLLHDDHPVMRLSIDQGKILDTKSCISGIKHVPEWIKSLQLLLIIILSEKSWLCHQVGHGCK